MTDEQRSARACTDDLVRMLRRVGDAGAFNRAEVRRRTRAAERQLAAADGDTELRRVAADARAEANALEWLLFPPPPLPLDDDEIEGEAHV